MVVMLMLAAIISRRRWRLAVAQSRRLRLQIDDQVGGIVLGDSQPGHENAGILRGEIERERILLRPHLVWIHDELHEPIVLAASGDAPQVRSCAIANPDGVAGCAQLLEQDLAWFGAEPIAG